MNIGKMFKDTARAITKPFVIGAAFLTLPFMMKGQDAPLDKKGKDPHAKVVPKDEYGYDKRDYKIYLGGGFQQSNSVQENMPYFVMGGEAPLDRKGITRVKGEYMIMKYDPNTVNFGYVWQFQNRRGQTTAAGFSAFTYTPARSRVGVSIGMPTKNGFQAGVEGGFESYATGDIVPYHFARPYGRVFLGMTLGGKNQRTRLSAEIYGETKGRNQDYFDYFGDNRDGAVMVGARFLWSIHPGVPGRKKSNRQNVLN